MRSKYFTSEDTECHCGCGFNDPDSLLLEFLDELCEKAGTRLQLTCVCRCPEHNAEVGGVTNSQHTRGTAADIAVPYGMDVDELADLALDVGFDGIGRYYEDDFVHVDVRAAGTQPGGFIWSDED